MTKARRRERRRRALKAICCTRSPSAAAPAAALSALAVHERRPALGDSADARHGPSRIHQHVRCCRWMPVVSAAHPSGAAQLTRPTRVGGTN
jgi:hypothetical protein